MTSTEQLLSDPAAGSGAAEPAAPNLVTIDCSCRGKPHDHDTVVLNPEVSLPLGIAAAAVINRMTDETTGIGELSPVYLRFGVVAWTLVDADGKPEPVTPQRIAARLTYANGGFEVVEAAAGLYSETVMRPLLAARARFLQALPQDHLTPRKNGTGRKPRTLSGPSSPSATAGMPSSE